jgi:hypothetical protein
MPETNMNCSRVPGVEEPDIAPYLQIVSTPTPPRQILGKRSSAVRLIWTLLWPEESPHPDSIRTRTRTWDLMLQRSQCGGHSADTDENNAFSISKQSSNCVAAASPLLATLSFVMVDALFFFLGPTTIHQRKSELGISCGPGVLPGLPLLPSCAHMLGPALHFRILTADH